MAYYEHPLFQISPKAIQHAIFSVRNLARSKIPWLFGRRRTQQVLTAMEYQKQEALEAYQGIRLQALVRFACRHVAYYQELFTRMAVRPEDIRTPGDLGRLPLIDKRMVRQNPERFLSRSACFPFLSKGLTSGTTGVSLRLYRDLKSICWEEARLWRWRLRAGILPRHKRAVVRGDNFVSNRSKISDPWLKDRWNHLMAVSSYHLSDELLPRIVRKMLEFSPDTIEGYPSALCLLARYLNDTGKRIPVRAVLTSSEQLYPSQRGLLARSFQTDVFDQYGQAERVALSSECSHHRMHVDMECSIVEVVKTDGTPCREGEAGEIVGTNLVNFAMPLIRYRTGDIGRLKMEACPCGQPRVYLEEIQGRDDDFVVGANGNRFPPILLAFPFDTVEDVEDSQIVQSRPGRLLIKLVPASNCSDPDLSATRTAIRKDLDQRLGGSMTIEFEIVQSIPKNSNGKFRWVIAAGHDAV